MVWKPGLDIAVRFGATASNGHDIKRSHRTKPHTEQRWVVITSGVRPNMNEERYVVGASPSYQTCWPRAWLGMNPTMVPWHLRQSELLSNSFLSAIMPSGHIAPILTGGGP